MKVFSAILIATSILWGCSMPEVLPSRDGAVPIGVDLSGNWLLRTNSSSDQVRVRDAIRQTDGVKDDDVFTQPDRQSASEMHCGADQSQYQPAWKARTEEPLREGIFQQYRF